MIADEDLVAWLLDKTIAVNDIEEYSRLVEAAARTTRRMRVKSLAPGGAP